MSHLWRDRAHIALSPDRVILARLGRGARVLAREIVPCSVPAGDTGWEPALAAMRGALAGGQWANADATVILSNQFVRYLLVPRDEKLVTEEEQLAMLRHSFTQAYGGAAENWEFRWSEGRPPAPCLASAVDRALLEGVREAFKASGLRLVSVQPYLMLAFNHWRREMREPSLWFGLAERDRLCLAWIQRDEWGSLYTQRIGPEWPRELSGILERAALLAGPGSAPCTVYLHVPEQPDVNVEVGDGWSIRLLQLGASPGFSPRADAQYAMAVTV